MKITKQQLRTLIQEAIEEDSPVLRVLSSINDGTAKASVGMGLGPDEILVRFGPGPSDSVVLKVRGF